MAHTVYTELVLFTKKGKANIQGVCEGVTHSNGGNFYGMFVSHIEQRHRTKLVPLTLLTPFYNLSYPDTRLGTNQNPNWRNVGRKKST